MFAALCGIALLLMLVAAPAAAHHSVLGFDDARGLTLRGAVAAVHWADPHTYITLTSRGRNGREERWRVESESAIVLRRLGWTLELLPPGTQVTIVGAPARDGGRTMRCQTVTLAHYRPLPCYPPRSL